MGWQRWGDNIIEEGSQSKMRGYCGIGVLNMKTGINYGTLFRSAMCFGADFIFLIGRKFVRQSSDTMKAHRHLPLYEYDDIGSFLSHRPYDCWLVGVEICERAKPIKIFNHPERAIYVLGPENGSLPNKLLDKCQDVLKIDTSNCLNVAIAGSIVLYDRQIKNGEGKGV